MARLGGMKMPVFEVSGIPTLQVRAEERRLSRDADAHRRIKHALAAHRGDESLSTAGKSPEDATPGPKRQVKDGVAGMHGAGEPKGRSAAGAVAAAVRELRPVEVVGMYEARLEGLEVPPLPHPSPPAH